MVLAAVIHDIGEAFREGTLLLSPERIEAVPSLSGGLPLAGHLMILVFTVLAMLLLGNFLNVAPYLMDIFLRARGSAALEGSVRVSRDRNIVALVLIIPFCLLMFRYRLWDPSFLEWFSGNVRILLISACFGVYLLLRVALCFALVPKRSNHDNYFLARRSAFNFFILLVTVQLLTVGICYLAGVPENILRMVLLAEAGFIYLVLIIRRGQILSAYCNPLATFLYLCALEILPTVLFVIPAVAL